VHQFEDPGVKNGQEVTGAGDEAIAE